ncbi:MAG: sulfatase-like hydrolase/transferase [Armatimonadota bacterium]
MQFLRRVHPVAFAIGPILFLYARNSRELTLSALVLPLLGAVAVALVAWGACRLLQRDPDRAALMASGFLLPFFSYGALYHAADDFRGIPYWPYIFFAVWLALVAVLVIALARVRYASALVSGGVNTAAVVFLLMVAVSIGRTELARLRDRAEEAGRETAAAAGAPVPPEELPNIYYIILDSYGRRDQLAAHFQFDNRPFIRELQRRGFYVAEGSNANYCQTITSIPSSLNMRYLDDVAKKAGRKTSDRQPLSKLLKNSEVRRVLKAHGYRVVAFPSGYAPVSVVPSDVSMERLSGYTDFYFSAVNSTPLALISLRDGSVLDYYAYHRKTILWQFAHLPKTVDIPGPTFVFAHILAPHLPYVFDAKGNPVKGDPIAAAERRASQWSRGEETSEDVSRYCDELVYLNTLVLKTVDEIRARSKRPTVIILQADHGPGVLPNNYREFDKLDPDLRFGILNAYYFPDGSPPGLTPSISPVNTFRVVFNRYLGTKYPLLKDEHYFSPYTYPYDLRRMTEVLTMKKAK